MSWEYKKFIDFVLLQRGHDLTKAQIVPGGYPVVTSTAIMGYHNAFKAEGPGVITGRSGTIGEVQYIEENYWPHNTSLYVKDFRGNNPKFVYYFIKNFGTGRAKSGSAVPTLNRNNLSGIDIFVPDIDTQDRIADVLSNYDDLIENKQKQIKLLEEAAQRLYKEWFVDLRFPGYEDTQIVDDMPEGWKKIGLSEIAPIVTGKKDANYGTDDGKYLFFTCAQEPIRAPAYSFDCDAVILAGNGDFNVKLYRGKFEAYQRTYVFSPYNSENLYLLYHAVRENMRQLFQGASGSTIKFLTKHMLENILVYVPDEMLLSRYNSYCEAYQKKEETLKAQIVKAQEARDRLLPKLMNGEIEV